jgi:tetratricopeptide (TPR) repeat protein
MLTGRRPFPADNLAALVHAIEHRDPEPLSTPGRPVPPLLEQLVTSCLAKDPARRCGSAGEVRRQLEAISRLLDPRARLATEPTTVLLPVARRRGPAIRRASLLAAALAAAILLAGPSRLLRGLGLGTDARGRGAALLPLTPVGEEAADRPLCDGLTHALTACLARLEPGRDGAWIVPASEVRSRGVVGIDDARGLLGVRRTVGGALQVHGDILRLELIRNESSRGDWRSLLARPESRTVTGTLDELPAWQARAVAAAAELLGWQPAPATAGMGGPARGCGTHVPEAHAWYLRGCGLLQPFAGEPDPTAAFACFERALAADSTYAAARAGLGLALWLRHAGGEPDDGSRALAFCAAAMRQDGAAPEPPAALGAIHRARGEHEQALACFRRCLEIAPGDARALYLLARTQEALGRLDEAEATYRRAVSRRPGFMAAHNHYGAFLYRRNRYGEAVAQFRKVVELAPSYLRGLNNLGGICFYLERWPEAEAAFRRSLAIRPTPAAYLNLGTLYFYERRYVEAAHMYEESLELAPGSYLACGQAAECYYWSRTDPRRADGRYHRASALAESVLALAPGDLDAASSLVGYHLKRGRPDSARAWLRRVLDRRPLEPEVQFRLAAAYEQLGERDEAMAWLERTLEGGYSLATVERYPGLDRLRAEEPAYRALRARHARERER